MESLKIIVLCILASIAYGICQDMVTAHLCVEYFTVGHPPVLGGNTEPISLALCWGVLATWWLGLFFGLPAALLARCGSKPKLGWKELVRPIVVLMIVTGVAATIAGVFGALFFLSTVVPGKLACFRGVPPIRSHLYFADAAAHNAAYAAGFFGGIAIWGWIWWRRGRGEHRDMQIELDRLRRENRELIERLAAAS